MCPGELAAPGPSTVAPTDDTAADPALEGAGGVWQVATRGGYSNRLALLGRRSEMARTSQCVRQPSFREI
jgi:hypothetical protein